MCTKFEDVSFPLIFVPSRLCVRLIGRCIAAGVSFEASYNLNSIVTTPSSF
jgi:hypothetical protein